VPILGDTRETLANHLSQVVGIPFKPNEPDTISPPIGFIRPASPFADYRRAAGRSTLALYRFEILVLVARIADTTAHDRLNELASADGPLITGINSARMFRGPCVATEGTNFGPATVGGATYLGVLVQAEVLN